MAESINCKIDYYEILGVEKTASSTEIKKAYRKARAIEQKKREAQELDIARQRAPKTRAIRYDNLRSASAEEGLICMLLREPERLGALLPTLAAEEYTHQPGVSLEMCLEGQYDER